ncbi:hypothetical protein D3C71_1219020 [compost metagenome]
MSAYFTSIEETQKAINALAAELGLVAQWRKNHIADRPRYDDEQTWSINFAEQNVKLTITSGMSDGIEEDDEGREIKPSPYFKMHAYRKLDVVNKTDRQLYECDGLQRRVLFELRAMLVADYRNEVVDNAWIITQNGVTKTLPLTPPVEDERAYSFDWFDKEVQTFFGVTEPTCGHDYDVWEDATKKALEQLVVSCRWWSADGDSFGPLVRCSSLRVPGEGYVTINGYYG